MAYFKDDLYLLALELFQSSGYAVTSDVVFSNHLPEQVVYFDSKIDIYLSQAQRDMLKNITNVSHLFNFDADTFYLSKEDSVGFYSIEIIGSKRYRSQIAYDTHCILRPALSGKGNIILYRFDEEIMLTVQGFDSDVYLSDWYHQSDDLEFLAERIHICNMSLSTARDFIIDFAYSSARWYYVYPITGEFAAYNMIPMNYYSVFEPLIFNYREFKELVQSLIETAVVQYGDDYVEQSRIQNKKQPPTVDIQTELDLMALEVDLDNNEDMFGEVEGDDYQEVGDDFFKDVQTKDEYEFEHIDTEIFNDPLLMIKYLKKLEKM